LTDPSFKDMCEELAKKIKCRNDLLFQTFFGMLQLDAKNPKSSSYLTKFTLVAEKHGLQINTEVNQEHGKGKGGAMAIDPVTNKLYFYSWQAALDGKNDIAAYLQIEEMREEEEEERKKEEYRQYLKTLSPQQLADLFEQERKNDEAIAKIKMNLLGGAALICFGVITYLSFAGGASKKKFGKKRLTRKRSGSMR